MSIPVKGATTMKIAVAQIIPELMACQPKAAKNAPEKPPINVCEEEDGIPYHHVIKFHATDESSPAKIIGSGCIALAIKVSLTDFAIVVATL